MSFDPYHSVEFRWGASGEELKTSPDGPLKQKMYKMEARLRNQLERVYNCPTPYSLGPENPIDINVRNWLSKYLSRELPLVTASSIPGQLPSMPVMTAIVTEKKPEIAIPSRQSLQPESGKQMMRLAGNLFRHVDDLVLEIIADHLKAQVKN